MEVNFINMNNSLRPLLIDEEKLLCPVFGMISKKTKRMSVAASEYAYISVTSKGRLLLYRFDSSISYSEVYDLKTLIFGETQKLQSTGIYSVELSFLNEKGQQKDLTISIDPQPRGRAMALPDQSVNAEKFVKILNKLLP